LVKKHQHLHPTLELLSCAKFNWACKVLLCSAIHIFSRWLYYVAIENWRKNCEKEAQQVRAIGKNKISQARSRAIERPTHAEASFAFTTRRRCGSLISRKAGLALRPQWLRAIC
jgi:hypothetical protein